VYRAFDAVTGNDVALQILRDEPELEPIRRGFLRAAGAALNVRHPAVARCLDAGETERGDPYVVMELLRGQTLGQYLERVGRIPWPQAVRYLLDATAGLSAIHQAGLVHRDVKPDNLFLVGPLGAPTGLKVLDFGYLIGMVGEGEPADDWVVGTTEYMPPEQVLCDPVDARSDIYSLGAVLFRTLTGELPFAGVARQRLLAHHLVSPVPPASWLVEDLPSGLVAVISTALRKHPDNRFPSMAAMRQELVNIALDASPPFEVPALARDPDRYEPRGEQARAVLRALGAALAA
jgi:serine/threonine-protein kinase